MAINFIIDIMENIYITLHYTTHGIAYFKHILSAFYAGKCSINDNKIDVKNLNQDELNLAFEKKKNGFLFDKIYYLTAKQHVFDKISTRRFKYRKNMLSDDVVIAESTKHVWEDVIYKKNNSLSTDIEYVKNKYSQIEFEKYFSQLWRDMQHNTIPDQIYWFQYLSNASKHYKSRFQEVKTGINNLRHIEDISNKLRPIVSKLKKKHQNANFFINVSLGSNETQVVWHVLSEFDFLPKNSKLLFTYDIKQNNHSTRMMPFEIIELSPKIISEVSDNIKIYNNPKTESLKLAGLKMKEYLKSGFAILLLGERGIGKTRLAQEQRDQNKKFVDVNCASFTDNQIAQSELFGHKKGAFTGANSDKKGLFEEAGNGILFLDEIHHLDKLAQARLMKAIQTNENNQFTFSRLGDTKEIKIKTTLIFASNNTIEQLREKLLPDFFDRITQLVIEMPPLRSAPADLYDALEATWKHMKFETAYNLNFLETIGSDKKLLDWIKLLNLYGNYRDLQKITIYYKTFLTFSTETRKLLKEKSAFEFSKNQFEKYISFQPKNEQKNSFFEIGTNPNKIVENFKKELANWLIEQHGSPKNIEKYFKKRGEKITDRTIFNWKKSK